MSQNNNPSEDSTENSKEDFCGACLAVPAAIAGVGVAGLGAKGGGSHKKMKKIMLWVGIGVTVISIALAVFFLTRCKTCE